MSAASSAGTIWIPSDFSLLKILALCSCSCPQLLGFAAQVSYLKFWTINSIPIGCPFYSRDLIQSSVTQFQVDPGLALLGRFFFCYYFLFLRRSLLVTGGSLAANKYIFLDVSSEAVLYPRSPSRLPCALRCLIFSLPCHISSLYRDLSFNSATTVWVWKSWILGPESVIWNTVIWSSKTLATRCKEPTQWKRAWYWERLKRLRAGWEVGNRMRWMIGIPDSMDRSLSKLREIVEDRGAWRATVHRVAKSRIQHSDWTATTCIFITVMLFSWFRSFSSLLSSSWRQGKRERLGGPLSSYPGVLTPTICSQALQRCLSGSPFQGALHLLFLWLPSILLSCRFELVLLPWLKHFWPPGWSFTCLLGQQWSFLCTRLTQHSPHSQWWSALGRSTLHPPPPLRLAFQGHLEGRRRLWPCLLWHRLGIRVTNPSCLNLT